MTETTARKWRMSSLLQSAEKTQTRPQGEVVHMGPRLGVDSLDGLAEEILDAMKKVRVAEAEEERAQQSLEEMETQRRAREQELLELQNQLWHEIEKLGVLFGPPPGQGEEHG